MENTPDNLTPEARESLLKIRENIAKVNELEGEQTNQKYRRELILAVFLTIMGLVWALGKILSATN